MMRKLIILISVVVVFSCTEEKITPREYPRVRTYSVTEITTDGAHFNGEISYTAVNITDHGFIWHNSNNINISTGTKISLGPKSGAGLFDAALVAALPIGQIFYMKAYAISDGYLVYGELQAFEYVKK